MKPTIEQLDLIKLCKSALSKWERDLTYDETQNMIDSSSYEGMLKISLDYNLYSIFDIISGYESPTK